MHYLCLIFQEFAVDLPEGERQRAFKVRHIFYNFYIIFSCCLELCFNCQVWQLQESICFAIKYFEWFCKRGLSHIICLTPKCQRKKCFLDVGPQLHSKRWLKYNCIRKNLALSSWLAILIVDCLDFLVIACWSYTLNL